jgi:hypothetical protein
VVVNDGVAERLGQLVTETFVDGVVASHDAQSRTAK